MQGFQGQADDPIGGYYGGEDMISPQMAQEMQGPYTGSSLPRLQEPTLSRRLLDAGTAMLRASETSGLAGSVAAGLEGYSNSIDEFEKKQRRRRLDQIGEYELLGRIRERQLAEMDAIRKDQAIERFKVSNPDLADLAEIDPSAAASIMKERETFNFDKLADQGFVKYAQGLPVTPQEMAAMRVTQAKQRPVYNPVTEEFMGPSDILGSLSGEPMTPAPAPSYAPAPSPGQTPMQAPMQAAPSAIPAPVEADPINFTPENPRERRMLREEQLKQEFRKKEAENKKQNPMEFSDTTRKTVTNAKMMQEALSAIDAMGPDAARAKTGALGNIEGFLSAIPSYGMTDAIGSAIVSRNATPEQQKYLNAAMLWVRGKLRKDSGATIGAQEFIDEYKTFFPVAGDSPENIAQKAEFRKQVTDATVKETGGAYELMYPKGKDDLQGNRVNLDGIVATPKTRPEYDALPSGAKYIDPRTGAQKVKK